MKAKLGLKFQTLAQKWRARCSPSKRSPTMTTHIKTFLFLRNLS